MWMGMFQVLTRVSYLAGAKQLSLGLEKGKIRLSKLGSYVDLVKRSMIVSVNISRCGTM